MEFYNTASFDIDPQKGFTPLCPNELPIIGGNEIVDELNKNNLKARLRIGSKDCHPGNAIWKVTDKNPIFSPIEGRNVDIRWPMHCEVGTYGNELLDGLPNVSEYDFFIFKGIEPDMHPYGACYHDLHNRISTGVIEFLKWEGIKNVIIGGLALDYCVETTAIQLIDAKFNVIVNYKSTKSVDPTNEFLTIKAMESYGIKFINL